MLLLLMSLLSLSGLSASMQRVRWEVEYFVVIVIETREIVNDSQTSKLRSLASRNI